MSIPGHDALVTRARSLGADLAGGCTLPEASRVRGGLSGAFSLGIAVSKAIAAELEQGPTRVYAHHYGVINAQLDRISFNLVRFLERAGARAIPIPASQYEDERALAGLLPHKTPAALAGLGTVGANALLLTPYYGPRVRLATVLTDAPLPPPRPLPQLCTSCGRCKDSCPAGAIHGTSPGVGVQRSQLIDAHRCHQFIAARSPRLGAEVCGICVAVCPVGSSAG